MMFSSLNGIFTFTMSLEQTINSKGRLKDIIDTMNRRDGREKKNE